MIKSINAEANMSSEIVLRNFNPEVDTAFVYATFLRGVRHGCQYMERTASEAFHAEYTERLRSLIASKHCELVIACLSDDETIILSWVLLEPKNGILHFMFTKEPWRAKGLVRQVLSTTETRIKLHTHFTTAGEAIALKKGWTFNPFIDRLYK